MTIDPAGDVRRLVLAQLNPCEGACTVLRAHLADIEDDTVVTAQEVLDLIGTAMDSGEVPIGPFEYAQGDVEQALHDEGPVATMGSVLDGVTMLRVAIALGPRGWLAIGGSRYGHLPHSDRAYPGSAVLLPDVEAGLAELAVYTRQRARHLGYRGRVAVDVQSVCDRPLLLYAVDPTSGGLTEGIESRCSPTLAMEYSLDMPPEHIEALHYEAAARLAHAYGVAEPQWFARPALDVDGVDDLRRSG